MKRIIIVILAASLMLCSLAFNASANEMEEGTYSGRNYIARLNLTTSSASIYLSYGNQYTPLSASGSARKIQTSTSVEKTVYLSATGSRSVFSAKEAGTGYLFLRASANYYINGNTVCSLSTTT